MTITIGEATQRQAAGVVTRRETILSRRVWTVRVTLVLCVVACVVDGEICGYVGEASQPLDSPLLIRLGPPGGRVELLRRLGV